MNKFKEKSYTAPIEKDRTQQGKYKEKLDYKFFISKKNNKINIPKSGSNTIISTNPVFKKKTLGSIILISIISVIGILFFFMIISLLFIKKKDLEI